MAVDVDVDVAEVEKVPEVEEVAEARGGVDVEEEVAEVEDVAVVEKVVEVEEVAEARGGVDCDLGSTEPEASWVGEGRGERE